MTPAETQLIKFTIYGNAVPAVRMTQRSKWSKRASAYLTYKEIVGWSFTSNKLPKFGKDIQLGCELDFYLTTKRRVDLDNLIKSVLDGLNEIAYHDDSQIVEIKASKNIGEEIGKTVVSIYEI